MAEGDLLIAVTRLRLASWRHLPRFMLHAARAVRQARAAPGCRGLRLLADRRLAFWTATAWDDGAALGAFYASGDHRAAMPLMASWCDEGAVVRFLGPVSALDDWGASHARLLAEGRPTSLPRHSADQSARTWAPPRPGRLRGIEVAATGMEATRPPE